MVTIFYLLIFQLLTFHQKFYYCKYYFKNFIIILQNNLLEVDLEPTILCGSSQKWEALSGFGPPVPQHWSWVQPQPNSSTIMRQFS